MRVQRTSGDLDEMSYASHVTQRIAPRQTNVKSGVRQISAHQGEAPFESGLKPPRFL
jgi:hypothetical protein